MPEEPDSTRAELDNILRQVSGQLNKFLGNMYAAVSKLPDLEDPKDGRCAAMLTRSFSTLLRLANNLEYASILAQPGRVELKDKDIVSLCREIVQRAEAPAELAGRSIEFRCKEWKCVMAVDGEQLERLLLNLISNALKFTEPGGHVAVELERGTKQSGQIILRVIDDGPGIPPSERETMYERYLHTDKLDPPPYGLGLGLPIARHIAVAHGGRLFVTSVAGKGGTTVTVELPCRKAPKHEMRSPALPAIDRNGGFNVTLRELADCLPSEAFSQKYMD